MSEAPLGPAGPGAAYAWPPLPITDPDEAAKIMAERLGAAFDDLERERRHVVTSAGLGRKDLVDVFLREFQAALLDFVAAVTGNIGEFIRLHLGPRYEEAVIQATGRPMSWTKPHTEALTALASDTYSDFLKRSHEAQRVSEAFVRAVRSAAGSELPKIAAGGRTAKQAADRLEERLLTQYGIDHVTYRDGSHVPVRVYAHMAARTKSAVAYNAGTLNACVENGVGWVEVFDGPTCGWTHHEDTDLAARSIRTVADAGRYAIGHPNCRRGFGPRPDITTAAEAAKATSHTTDAQHADAVEQQRLKDTRAPRTRAAQQRRARLAVRRQARMLGATSTGQVADIIRSIQADKGLIDVSAAPEVVPAPGLTAELVADLAGGSAAPHIVDLGDGLYGFTPERAALHDRIIRDTLAGAEPQENPRYSLMGGGPAAGKSTMEGKVPEISQGAALVNADEVKAALPEYHSITDGSAAAFTHEESSYVAKRILAEGFKRRVNVTLDGTGNGRPEDLRAKLDQARAAGYTVNGYYVTVDSDEAVARATARGERTGRVVPESIIRGTHQKVSAALPSVLDDFDSLAIYDNNVNIALIAQKLPGQPFEVIDPVAWAKFLKKGEKP